MEEWEWSLYWGWHHCKFLFSSIFIWIESKLQFYALLLLLFFYRFLMIIQMKPIISNLSCHCKCPWWLIMMDNYSFDSLVCPLIHSVDRERGRFYWPCFARFQDEVSFCQRFKVSHQPKKISKTFKVFLLFF